jgi:hypothetical protein
VAQPASVRDNVSDNVSDNASDNARVNAEATKVTRGRVGFRVFMGSRG